MTDLSRLFQLLSLPEQIAAVIILGLCALIILSVLCFFVPVLAMDSLAWLRRALRPAPTNVVQMNEWARRERSALLDLHRREARR